MMASRRLRALALAATVAGAGCASSAYTPRAGRRLSAIVKDDHIRFVRDGATFDTLEEAVKGNPAAEAFAHKSKVHNHETIGAYSASMLCLLSGVFLFGRATGQHTTSSWEPPTTFGLLGCSIALSELAGVTARAAIRDYWDAMNTYNDAAEAR
jgi:hypothetical protein